MRYINLPSVLKETGVERSGRIVKICLKPDLNIINPNKFGKAERREILKKVRNFDYKTKM